MARRQAIIWTNASQIIEAYELIQVSICLGDDLSPVRCQDII